MKFSENNSLRPVEKYIEIVQLCIFFLKSWNEILHFVGINEKKKNGHGNKIHAYPI